MLACAPLTTTNAATIDVKLAPYYALGDGVSDDTNAIQAAIDENPNSVILLKNGTFKITNYLTLKNRRILKGENGTLLYSSANCGTMISCDSNVDILNLAINGNNQATMGISVLPNESYIFVSNCELFNFAGNSNRPAYGIQICNSTSDITIFDTSIHDIDGGADGIMGNYIGANRGILIGSTIRTIIDRCKIYNIGPWEDGDCIHVQTDPSDVIIRGSEFYNFKKRAVKVQASGVVVTNNLISCDYAVDGIDAPYSGISIYSGNCEVSNNTIILNRALVGIEFRGDNVQVNNNYVDVYGHYTLCRGTYIRSLYVEGSNYCSVTNNTLLNYYSSVTVNNSYDNVISNNNILHQLPWLFDFINCTNDDNMISDNIDYSTVLAGFWRFNVASDASSAYDFSTHALADCANCTYTTGYIGGALQFNGSAPPNNSFTNLSSFNLQLKANTSIAFWIKSDNPVGYGSHPYYPGIFSSSSNGSYDNFITFRQSSSGYANILYEDENGASGMSDVFPYITGEWVHITIVMDNNNVHFYVNGAARGTLPASAPINLRYLGCGYGGAYNHGALKGRIDEFMYFNKTLSAEEVNNIYLKREL